MVTKSDYGLGPLYHGTSKDSADAILEGGLLLMARQPIWLSFSQEEALENAREKEGLPVVLEVNLPEDWLLDRAEAGTYLSWRDIPPEYIKPVAKQEYVQTYGESGNPDTYGEAPNWAKELIHSATKWWEEQAKEFIPEPELWWIKGEEYRVSTGGEAYIEENSITIVEGPDLDDARFALLHELAHIFSKEPHHTDYFWDVAAKLYQWVGFSPSQVFRLGYPRGYSDEIDAALERLEASSPSTADWMPKFIMYHATPASNAQSILQYGILPSVVPFQYSRWAPKVPVVYMSDSIGTVKDYAEQTWEYYKMKESKWAIFKIEYDEFPEEPHADLLWGLPGTYYTTIAIPSDHVKLIEYFDAAVEPKSSDPGVVLRPFSLVEPHIFDITYEGVPMVGTVITRTLEDSLLVTELAVDEPGIVSKGFLSSLGDALEVIAKNKGLQSVKVEYLPQHLKMYELASFSQSYEEGEAGMVVRHVGGSSAQYGTCYSDAWRFLIKQDEGFLIHGSVQFSAEAPRVNHAWVELSTGWVWEPQTKSYYTIEDFRIMSPMEEHRYSIEEAAIIVARVGKHGPWTDEERAQWIR